MEPLASLLEECLWGVTCWLFEKKKTQQQQHCRGNDSLAYGLGGVRTKNKNLLEVWTLETTNQQSCKTCATSMQG